MPVEDVMEVYLNSVIGLAKTLSEFICSSEKADFIFSATAILMNEESKTEHDIELLELTFYVPELVKECRSSFLESNRAVIAHLEKFQLHGYHFENLIHALKLEDETLSEEIHFA